MNKKVSFLFIILIAMLFAGCISNSNNETTSPSTNTPTTDAPTNPPTDAPMTTPPKEHGDITWITYDKAVEEAKISGKHMLLYFWRPNCTFCDKMEKTTFVDPEVVSYMEENFLPVGINIWSSSPISQQDPSISGKNLETRFKVIGAPSYGFVDSEGNILGTVPGYKEPEDFKLLLEFVSTKAYLEMTYQEFLDSK
ncbi:MAG: thioredoxin family protein [Candidatus Methanofastidiosia archaeon]